MKAPEITRSFLRKFISVHCEFVNSLPTFEKMLGYNCSPFSKVSSSDKNCRKFRVEYGQTLDLIQHGATILHRIIQKKDYFVQVLSPYLDVLWKNCQ